ncbi:MAG: TonB-dependent receptor plug domain-containing protein, partial [Gammaproteobacteria bacterium]|nr:TonB-dependent receptor plug domain-containing protein [Gammaproteobacteria bacterium]
MMRSRHQHLRQASGRAGAALSLAAGSVLGAVARAQEAVPGDALTADGLEQVTVTGVRSLLSDKLAQDPQDVPQSLTVVSEELMEAQAATRLEDALRNVPGITLNAGEGAARGDTVNLRGFSAFNDFFLDGIRDAAVYGRDTFNLESVEVLKGPAAVLFGRGSTGGAINQVSKAPLLKSLREVSTDVGTNDLYRATADLNETFAAADALRLNVMGESSQVAGRDLTRNRRWGVAPAVSFGIGEPQSLTLALLHQQENNVPDPGVPFLSGAPAPVPRQSYFGLAADEATSRVDIGTLRWRQQLAPNVVLADTLRYARYHFSFIATLPNLGEAAPAPGTSPADVPVYRDAPASAGLHTNLTNQADVTLKFHTGVLEHTLAVGLEVARQTVDLERLVNPFDADPTWVPPTPLLAPDPYELAPAQPVGSLQRT